MNLEQFVAESNRIEGILRPPTDKEIGAHVLLLDRKTIGVADLVAFVETVEPGARLREYVGLDVRVGDHTPPPGGPNVVTQLNYLLRRVNLLGPGTTLSGVHNGPRGGIAYGTHCEYETLHPFTDGNGRSGRALWLWQMGGLGKAPLGFLHHFYYQALAHSRA